MPNTSTIDRLYELLATLDRDGTRGLAKILDATADVLRASARIASIPR